MRVNAPGPHEHRRDHLTTLPSLQPVGRTWRCTCGAALLPTYRIGPCGIDERGGPTGLVWVEAEALAAALNRASNDADPAAH